MSLITFSIKRGSFWQDGEQRHATHVNPELRTIKLTSVERDRMDPTHTDLQSAEEVELEAKKLEVDAELAKKRAAALAKIDAEHKAELEAKAKKPASKKDGDK